MHGEKKPKSAKKEKASFPVFAAYSKALSGARHHALIQANYNVLSSTWLLATFGAIGFLLTSVNFLPFNNLLGVAAACLVGIVGLYFLWYESTVVQELLLDMNVVEGLALEKKHPWLPQLHHSFLHLYQNRSVSIVKALFFIGCKTILLLIMAISLCFYFYQRHHFLVIITVAIFIIINFISSQFMLNKEAKIGRFMEYLSHVDDRL